MRVRGANRLPNLLRQETSALAQTVNLLFNLCLSVDPKQSDDGSKQITPSFDASDVITQNLPKLCTDVLGEYASREKEWEGERRSGLSETETERELNALTPIAVLVVSRLAELPTELFSQHVQWVFPQIVSLIRSSSPELRAAVSDVMSNCVAPLLPES